MTVPALSWPKAIALLVASAFAGGLAAMPAAMAAGDEVEVTVSIKDHKFEPANVKVPAGKPVKLTVRNLDETIEEFESKPLRFEKIVGGGTSATVRLQPLAKGSYGFFGEFHEETAQGAVIAE
jgi:plastocyanin